MTRCTSSLSYSACVLRLVLLNAERAGSGRGRAGGPMGEGAASWRLQDRSHKCVGPGAHAAGHCRCAALHYWILAEIGAAVAHAMFTVALLRWSSTACLNSRWLCWPCQQSAALPADVDIMSGCRAHSPAHGQPEYSRDHSAAIAAAQGSTILSWLQARPGY